MHAPYKVSIIQFSEKEEDKTEEDHDTEKEMGSSENIMDTSETRTVSSQSIIGQICFDLGTLYFYKGNIEKAKSLFEICSSVQVSSELQSVSHVMFYMLCVIQLTPHWGFSVAEYIRYYAYF